MSLGKLWERECREMFECMGGFVYRAPDVLGHRFTLKSPFDMVVFFPTQVWAVECKATRQEVFSLARISDHQWRALATLDQWIVQSKVLLNFRNLHSPGIAFAIPFREVRSYHRRSIRKDTIDFDSHKLRRVVGGWVAKN